jgi:UrcA family protein
MPHSRGIEQRSINSWRQDMGHTRKLLVMALALTAAPFAQADNAFATPTRTVEFADLNLAHAEGAHALYARLEQASRAVCASLDSRDLRTRARRRACIEQAIAAAVAKVDRPLLTQYHNAQNTDSEAPVSIASR